MKTLLAQTYRKECLEKTARPLKIIKGLKGDLTAKTCLGLDAMDVLDYGHKFITFLQNPGYRITGLYKLFFFLEEDSFTF